MIFLRSGLVEGVLVIGVGDGDIEADREESSGIAVANFCRELRFLIPDLDDTVDEMLEEPSSKAGN
jgi:hypothetical protein